MIHAHLFLSTFNFKTVLNYELVTAKNLVLISILEKAKSTFYNMSPCIPKFVSEFSCRSHITKILENFKNRT